MSSEEPKKLENSAVARADAALDRAVPARHSLAPGRARAHTLAEVLTRVADAHRGAGGHVEPAVLGALGAGLAAIALAELDAFPSNLFWDFDYLAAALFAEASELAGPVAAQVALLDQRCRQIVGLQHLYGRETAIGFTYVHDFIYGYDWAKWIRRDPPDRRVHGPFSAVFLGVMEARGHQLLEVIAGDHDRKYPSLGEGSPRNPFPFSREPASELVLHRDLAARGALPVEAWRIDAEPRWDRNFAAIRADRARSLRLDPGPPALALGQLRP